MPSWPADLPFIEVVQTLQKTGPSAVIRTPMGAGPANVRPRFTAAPEPIRGEPRPLTKDQIAEFETFFRDDLAMGALGFNAPDPITGATRTYRFTGPYKISALSQGFFRLTLDLEVLP